MPKAFIKIVAPTGSALALLASGAWAAQAPSDADRYAWGPPMMWWGGGWYAMIPGPLFMLLVLAVPIAAVFLLARRVGGPWQGTVPPHSTPPGRTPLDILKERFARGEID